MPNLSSQICMCQVAKAKQKAKCKHIKCTGFGDAEGQVNLGRHCWQVPPEILMFCENVSLEPTLITPMHNSMRQKHLEGCPHEKPHSPGLKHQLPYA